MKTLEDFHALCHEERGLASIAVARADGAIHSSVVNVAVLTDPHADTPAIGFVTYGAVKLRNLRVRPKCTVTIVAGRNWVSIEGTAEILGPDDLPSWFDSSRLPSLLREVFIAAGGTHSDWDEYDRVMAEQRRAAVFVVPERIYGV